MYLERKTKTTYNLELGSIRQKGHYKKSMHYLQKALPGSLRCTVLQYQLILLLLSFLIFGEHVCSLKLC